MRYQYLHPGQPRLRTLEPHLKDGDEAPRDGSDDEGPMKRRSEEEDKSQDNIMKVNIPNKRQEQGDWRIMFGNLNGFPLETSKANEIKLDIWGNLFKQADADVVGVAEHKLNIPRLGRRDKPSNIMRNWREGLVGRYSWLQNNEEGKYELGGTGIISSSIGTTHTIREGMDSRRLGRWNWITLQGKKGKKTTIVTVYRPEEGQQTLQRQFARLRAKGIIKEGETTLTIWEKDLLTLIKSFIDQNHEVVVGGDWNNNLNNAKGKVRSFMKGVGMEEVLIKRYGRGTNTHIRGKDPIDGIFTTPGISMIRGGYTTFECSPSDHKWVWMDIREEDIVGVRRDDRAPPIERRATTKIPSVKKAFQDLMEQQVMQHRTHEQMLKLFQEIKHNEGMTDMQASTYERIEERMRRSVIYADKRCRKVRRGKTPFSPQAKKIIGEIRVLKEILIRNIRSGQQNRPRMRKIKRMASKYKYQGPLQFDSKEAIIDKIRSAKIAYRHFQPRSVEARYKHLENIATEFAEQGDKGAEWHFNRLITNEKNKDKFKNIRRAEGKGFKRGVDRVDVMTPQGLKTILDRDDIDQAIKEANCEKRLQARHTPFRMEPLRTLVGEKMDFERWESILKKEVLLPQEEVEEGTGLWFQYIQNYDSNPMDISWTTEEYIQSWKKMKEDKSSAPGIHAVHIKCLDHDTQSADILSKLALIPLLTGYAPLQWRYGVDSMIPKKTVGELRPEKLRLILLMDARFNHNNKLIGKKLMQYGEKHSILAAEQFGSRKDKSAIEHAVNKRLTLDLSRQTKTKCIYIANDAKSCYDRILMMITYLTMRNFGIPQPAAWSSIETLARMKMQIKTMYGISELTYGGDEWQDFPHGIGQGNGYGPAIWAAISSPLLGIMKEKGYGTHITSPITKEHLHMAAFSFVDDTDQLEMNTDKQHSWNQLVSRTQSSLSLWESLLRTTGGAIEPSKSDWVRLNYKWNKGKASLVHTLAPDILTMRDSGGTTRELLQQPPHTARETLGVWQAPSGIEKQQVQQLQEKIKTWGNTIAHSDIMRSETRTAVHVTIGRSIRYPLAATAITSKDATKIDSVFRRAALGRMGIVRTAPALPTGAPQELGGLGMAHNVEINQMIDHIDICTKHGHTHSATGKLLRASFENMALEGGVLGDPTRLNMSELPWVTENTWVGNTLESLTKHDLHLHSGMKGLCTWTNIDQYTIMEKASPYLTKGTQHIFNKVRLHLHVVTVSDIITADGRHIDENIFHGKQSTSPTPSAHSYIWPKVPPPTKKEVKIWNQILGKIFSVTANNLCFPSNAPMKWDHTVKDAVQWNYDPISGILYELKHNKWLQWIEDKRTTRRRRSTFNPNGTVYSIPSTVRPATINLLSPCRLQLVSLGQYGQLEGNDDDTTGWILRRIQATQGDEEEYAERIRHERGEILSDGSYKNNRSSSAFRVIHTEILGSNTVPGSKEDQSSYRGELAGILASILYTNKVCQRKGIHQGKCTMYCDNKGALQASFGWKTPNSRWSSFDLVSLIRFHLANSPITWKWQHVYGHQDNDTAYEDLTPQARANVDADKAAEIELDKNLTPSEDPVQGQSWQLYDATNKRFIKGNYEKTIRTRVFEQPMKDFWVRKFQINHDDMTPHKWDIFKKHNKRLNTHEAIWISKYNQRILGVKKNMLRRKHSPDDKCPLCSTMEDTDHIYRCQSKEAQEAYNESLETVDNFLTTTTSANIRDAIIEICHSLRECRRPRLQNHWSPRLISAIHHQLHLGLRAFLGGIWAEEWVSLQQAYLTGHTKSTCPKLWVCKSIQSIQKMIKTIWASRNRHMHNNENSEERKRQHTTADTNIDIIFAKKKNISNRTMTTEAAAYFTVKPTSIKNRTLRRKQRWIQDATDILDTFTALTPQQQRFLRYFQFRDSG